MSIFTETAVMIVEQNPDLAREIARIVDERRERPVAGLTRRQRELLDFIKEHMREHPYAPSFEDMMNAVGLASKSGVFRLLTALEERGYISRLPCRARAIKVLEAA